MKREGRRTSVSVLVEDVLRELVEGRGSRDDAVEWARAMLHARESLVADQGELVKQAIGVLGNADTCEADVNRRGEPYFFRPGDFREWLGALRREDRSSVSKNGLKTQRPHQVRDVSGLRVSLECSLREAVLRLGIETIRGKDDLDFYDGLLCEMASGVQVSLLAYARSPYVEAYFERDAPERALEEFLVAFGWDSGAVAWRSDVP